MVKYVCLHINLYDIFLLFAPNEKYSQLHTEISEAWGSEKKEKEEWKWGRNG